MNATEPQNGPAAPAGPAPPPTQAPGRWTQPLGGSDPRRKSPVLACILSVMPGLGQVYVGYYKLGFVHLAVWASTISTLVALNGDPPAMVSLVALFMAFFFLYNIIDAGRRATFYNQALDGVDGIQLPAEMSLPSPGGSIAGGAILIGVGAVLLSHTLFGYSLTWLEDWWPAAPILVGAWLLVRGILERRETE